MAFQKVYKIILTIDTYVKACGDSEGFRFQCSMSDLLLVNVCLSFIVHYRFFFRLLPN